MIKLVEKEKNYIYIEAKDMITKEDVGNIIPEFEDLIKKFGKVRTLIVMDKVKGYSLEGFLVDFNFYLKHKNNFDYTAFVGDKKLEKHILKLSENIMPGKVRYFDVSELDKAKEWIKQQ
ncbi:MAG: hypothetical protein A2287_05435 [Candidatus Melainabacteria bacterium RIFOXYA12_FULL_32_12]|nr:MAG: hypothetical protein A2255_03905 [Candidatus Melainabacteria bacterium RIFOXYA2_FULL_32_9]OGI31273.1 MAG: hypothetical protein A2287_05435 [Candidatus Melainabacteria bacterium RIFOXYA12_FULL_32_12]